MLLDKAASPETWARIVKKKLLATGRLLRSLGRQKIYCVGQNKTGTTSLAQALVELNISVAPTLHDHDPMMKRIFSDWNNDDFRRIVRLCYSAQAFQDYPFSLPKTFVALDRSFPGSKFVLTIRDTPEQWCDSFISYYFKKYWNGAQPRFAHQEAKNRHADFALDRMRMIYGDWVDPFDRQKLIQAYETQNQSVLDYFENRPDDLIVINVARNEDYLRLCAFLGKQPTRSSFPWLNRTIP